MVNVLRRLTGRVPRASNTLPESGTKDSDTTSGSHALLHRTTSARSAKRSWHRDRQAEEPVPRHLYLISDTPDYDPRIVRRFQAEGFDVEYMPFACTGDAGKDQRALENAVHGKEDELESGERYAIVGRLSS